MFFKLKVINFYQVLLDKLHMNFTGTRKQALTTGQRDVSKNRIVAKCLSSEDMVWHRSKSPRFQQN